MSYTVQELQDFFASIGGAVAPAPVEDESPILAQIRADSGETGARVRKADQRYADANPVRTPSIRVAVLENPEADALVSGKDDKNPPGTSVGELRRPIKEIGGDDTDPVRFGDVRDQPTFYSDYYDYKD